jgi:hypothetical protein
MTIPTIPSCLPPATDEIEREQTSKNPVCDHRCRRTIGHQLGEPLARGRGPRTIDLGRIGGANDSILPGEMNEHFPTQERQACRPIGDDKRRLAQEFRHLNLATGR